MPNIVLIAGPNGAGKSTAAPSLLRDTLGIDNFVNADQIAAGTAHRITTVKQPDAWKLIRSIRHEPTP